MGAPLTGTRVSGGSEDSVGAASAEDRHSAVDGRFRGDTKSRPHLTESSDDSVGATGAVHRRTDENPSCATENKSPTVLRRRSVITQRRCRSSRSQKTVKILQALFVNEVVDVAVVMHGRCLKFRSAQGRERPASAVD